ncbi:hypothetical protein HBH47_202280 [Parastagonospora nodorum]|nr:hypothetical protein HBH47_202280 [Parastagonospora nodorum]
MKTISQEGEFEADKALCKRCATIPLRSAAFNRKAYSDSTGSLICFVENKSWLGCKMCTLLRLTVEEYQLVGDLFALVGRRQSSLDETGTSYRPQGPVVMLYMTELRANRPRHGRIALEQVTACQFDIYPHRHDETGRNLQRKWDVFSEWMQHCTTYHLCGADRISHTLLGFRVIDITTRSIISAPRECSYVALSYVWGAGAGDMPSNCISVPHPAASTIEDAMTCTQALGFNYLWVDRYCVDQSESPDQQIMIQNMDRIYNNAVVTIIDAAGSDSRSGLSGISATSKPLPRPVDIYEHRLSIVPNVVAAVRKSKWASRGWTYQEGLLSQRRLVFTDSQVYFQCMEMQSCESLSTYHESSSLWLERTLRAEYQVFPFHSRFKTEYGAFTDRLDEYLPRDLTFQSDILNAFMGVMRQLWNSPEPKFHFWGLPFTSNQFLVALLWLPECKSGLLTRRYGFPSWTWAGWKGITSILGELYNWPDDNSLNVSAYVKDTSGNQFDPKAFVLKMNEIWDISLFRKAIKLTGWTVSVWIRPRYDDLAVEIVYGDVLDSSCSGSVTTASIILPYLPKPAEHEENMQPETTWQVLLFVLSLHNRSRVTGIVLKHIENDVYERAGVLHWADFEPMIQTSGYTSRLRKHTWDRSIWLDCRKHSIELV